MSEPRKNHLCIEGGQVKEDENIIACYKLKPDSDAGDFRSSKASLHKSREKVDEAEEKLLDKEEEVKIVTRVDMADAKYVVGDHRNGDAKIELDANKRQFSGLTKEELMRYADDPFWVRLRWALFALFWALWLCMLAGAIAIIVQAPKCALPTPRTWYERDPLVDASSLSVDELPPKLALLRSGGVSGVFARAACGEDSYHVLQAPECVQRFQAAVTQAKEYGVKIIVDLVANFVPVTHAWFKQSENRSGEFTDYFIWADGKGFDATTNLPLPPNNWVAVTNEPAWSYSDVRKQFYLHQYGAGKADLNLSNPVVAAQFENVLKTWMQAGAGGVRLVYARQLLVSSSLANESLATADKVGLGAVQTDYAFYRHQEAADRPELAPLLARWAKIVDDSAVQPDTGSTLFTLAEAGGQAELHLLARAPALRPPSAAPLDAGAAPRALATTLTDRLRKWPLLQLKSSAGGSELAAFSLLLPATPVFTLDQLEEDANTTASEKLAHVAALRADASIQHGNWTVLAAPARDDSDHQLLAVARWKAGHTGYVAVWNPHSSALRANLSALAPLPAALSVHRVSASARRSTNYTSNFAVESNDVLVPAASTVVLSFVPNTNAEQ